MFVCAAGRTETVTDRGSTRFAENPSAEWPMNTPRYYTPKP